MKNLSRALFVVFVWILLLPCHTQGQSFSYSNEPLLSVIQDIEANTPYRFLYREALISGIKVTLNASDDHILQELTEVLIQRNIGLKIDEDRHQALIYKSVQQQLTKNITISGYVVDSETGERLPYATISWRENGLFKGVATTSSGAFSISITSNEASIFFLTTYLGYKSNQIELPFDEINTWNDLTIRLEPETYGSKEIIVSGVNFYTPQDTLLKGLIKIGTFSPLGETNAFKSLQMLPSVSMSSAINDGINIRGSSTDGFHILLDGQTVYNQSHLFGMLDAMNSDALKTSGFFYDITPAQYQAPLGGTLSMVTRSGSINEFNGSAGLSNTAFKSTLDGPIIKGKSSWLVSGRLSYIDDVNWFNNGSMIEYGLDVNRPAEIVSTEAIDFLDQFGDFTIDETEVEETDAQFYDIHGKLYFETANGSQITLSGYAGYDKAYQNYSREFDPGTLYETTNNWASQTITGSYAATLGTNTLSNSRIGYTYYSSSYLKDDFEYPVRRNQNSEGFDSVSIQPLDLENSIQQFDIAQSFFLNHGNNSTEIGFSYSDYEVEYVELSLQRQSFASLRTSQLFDVYHQTDISSIPNLVFNLGNRFHYFSNGEYLRWSPRLKVNYHVKRDFSMSIGYSRNYQFMHRLAFYNINSNDFWILTNEDEPPSSVDYFSSGLYYNLNSFIYFQVEGYYKFFSNIRLHELNTGLISAAFSNREVPVLYDNFSRAKGLEFLIKNRFKDFSISSAYTLSSSRIRNNDFNEGKYFYSSWDRRHQLSVTTETNLAKNLTFYLGWTYGSGTPDYVNPRRIEDTFRLSDYSRLDATIDYQLALESGILKTSFSLYNIFNRNNPWYAERKLVNFQNNNRTATGSAITTVYDLGIQPSFNISFSF
ncbi:MAG: TonB-dependent receptor [Balneolales bacterium]|nr:TonB-dependent receptor [Balneolales bacterium]